MSTAVNQANNQVLRGYLPLGPGSIAQMNTLARQGQPPLRFKGWLFSRDVSCNGDLFVELWVRKKGDFVVSYSDISQTDCATSSHVFATMEAAASHLELICKAPETRPAADLSYRDVSATLTWLCVHRAQRRNFAILVGDTLAHWANSDALQSYW